MNYEESAVLDELGRIAREIGDERSAAEASALSERVNEGRFFVACVGQFKRGKSTLLDALIGVPVLPIGILPVTAVPTVVRHGSALRARVRLGEGGWRNVDPASLHLYVSEEHNPGNVRGVLGAEVFAPSELLAGGMCLVDTPGLGSVFAANSAVTRDFVPHVDVALVVLGADPPITAEELTLIEEINARVPDLLFVLNKADRVTKAERVGASEFAQRVIAARLGRARAPIWVVSAAQQLEGGPETWDWEKFVLALTDLSQHSSRRIVRGAVVRGVKWLCRRLLARLDERTDALVQPAEQVALRLASLERIVADVEGSMRDLAPLFAAEQRRLGEECRRRREGFLREAGPQARRELAAWMETRGEHGRTFRIAAARQTQELARTHVTEWLTAEQQWAEDAYRRVTQRFASAASAFVSRVSAVDAGVAYAADELDVEQGFTERSRFYFHEYEAIADPASPLRYVTDVIRGRLRARARIERDVLAFLDLLLEVNSARVESDLSDRIAESRRRLEARILMLLRELGTSARHAVDEATRVRAHGHAATAAALRRLSQLRVEVESLRRAPPA